MPLDIKGFSKTSFLDWDGKVVSTLYVAGCNFRCPFCHNASLIEEPQSHESIPLNKIESFLLEHKDFIDGICLTGGEPCLHVNNGLSDFLRYIKGMGFQVKLDSNGANPGCLKDLHGEKLIDYIAMDIKGPLDERYNKLAGIKSDLARVKQSIEFIMSSGIGYEFRTTVVPTLLSAEDVVDIAKHISGARKFVLQQFVPKHAWAVSLREVKPYTREQLNEMKDLAKQHVPNTVVRGA
ncbi:MAG: anaerobic ribonucleoside-triphosphate reductase activating protein [Candidatus Margulisbacteria bacterium]|nr:anaerobic ribonucleoside-triphosphate reductase activating protein [Candidatus Margulisiibacteriota bacterium]